MIYCEESIDIGSCVTVVINHKYVSLGKFISDRKICKAIINQDK